MENREKIKSVFRPKKMPTMHGAGHHHYLQKKRDFFLTRWTRKILNWIFGEDDHERLKKFFDRSIYFIGVVSPAMTVPQVWKVWENHSTAGLVSASWITYLIVSFFWLGYGIVHKEKPIILINVCWILVNSAMVAGIYLYG